MKKYIAFAVSLLMICSSFSACGNKAVEPDVSEAVSSVSETVASSAAETEENNDVFGDDYDPFADDYDPYGDSVENASAVVVTASTADVSSDENDEASDRISAETQSDPSQDKTDSKVQTASTEDTKTSAGAKKNDTSSKKNESANGISLVLNTGNGWNDGTSDYVQIDGAVKNGGSGNVSGWTVTISVSKNVSVDQSWNCNFTLKNGKITVTPVDYNTDISAGGEATFGMILKNASSVDASKATFKSSATYFSSKISLNTIST